MSEAGIARVNHARRRVELERNDGARISLEQLGFETGLSAKTISRLLSRDVPVDRRTIELLFAQLGLALQPDDVALPAARLLPERSQLPRYRTVLFDREDELARLTELARERMVVTLTGPGGVGKTRLATEWIRRTELAYSHICFLDLSLLTDGTTLREAIAAVLEDATADGEDVLLVLDGCEHLVDAAASAVSDLLDTMPRLSVLASSREPLDVGGEAVLRLAPLPDRTAFAMFVERARSFDDNFALSDDAAPVVAEIVRRLDGIPLALELAAARAAYLALPDLLASLRDHLEALKEGPRVGVPRHRSARALIDWSFELLTLEERAVFERLGAFMGSFDVAAVAALDAGRPAAAAVGDILTGLVRKSLLIADPSGPVTRFRMLETIRQYAAAKLAASGEAAGVRQRHALYYYDVAAGAAASEQHDLRPDVPNLREALEWCTSASRNSYLGAAIAARLVEFWEARGEFAEAEHWLRRALESESELVTLENRASLFEGLALVTYRRGRLSESRDTASSALRDYAMLDDVAGKLRARGLLGRAAMDAGEIASARDQFEANLSEGRETHDLRAISASLNNLGRLLAEHEGRFDAALPLFSESLEAARRSGLPSYVLSALMNLSECALAMGRNVAGLTYARLGIAEAEKLDNREATADLALQALAHRLRGDGLAAARKEAIFAADALANAPYRPMVAERLDGVALALHAAGEPRRAVTLLGATDAFRQRGEALANTLAGERRRIARSEMDETLAPGEAQALWTRGTTLALHDAFREALLDDDAAPAKLSRKVRPNGG